MIYVQLLSLDSHIRTYIHCIFIAWFYHLSQTHRYTGGISPGSNYDKTLQYELSMKLLIYVLALL